MQTWLSIIFMICRHSSECTILNDFLLDHTLLGQIELKWVSDCLKSSSRHSWTQRPRIWTRILCHTSHDAQSSDGSKHTDNSEWQNACGVSHGRETRRFHGPSILESRTADIYTNQTGLTQRGNSKVGNENTLRGPTTRRHSTRSC